MNTMTKVALLSGLISSSIQAVAVTDNLADLSAVDLKARHTAAITKLREWQEREKHAIPKAEKQRVAQLAANGQQEIDDLNKKIEDKEKDIRTLKHALHVAEHEHRDLSIRRTAVTKAMQNHKEWQQRSNTEHARERVNHFLQEARKCQEAYDQRPFFQRLDAGRLITRA